MWALSKLTIIVHVSGTGCRAFIIADLGRVRGYGISAAAMVALTQDGNLVATLGALVQALSVGLKDIRGVVL